MTSGTVVVEASAGQELQTESGSLSAEISSKEIASLPILSLNPIELVLSLASRTTQTSSGSAMA